MTKSSNTRDHIKTPSIDNDNNWFCSFILFPTSNQRTFQATEITTQYNDAECDDNSVHDHNKDNNDDRNYIIQKRSTELYFKSTQRDDPTTFKDSNRNPLLDINHEYCNAKEVTSLHNWKSSNLDGQHKYPPPAVPSGVFDDMNQMFHRIGIRFSNNQYEKMQSDSSREDLDIEAIGDAHLQRLHSACVEKILKLDFENEEKRIESIDILGNGNYHMAPTTSSLVSPFLGSSLDFDENSEFNDNSTTSQSQIIEVVSVALAYSEVLQLQGQSEKAIKIVEEAIEKLKLDMKDILNDDSKSVTTSYNWDGLDSNSEVTSKKMDLLLESHKRLGPLYKIIGDYENAEKHIRGFISLAEKNSDKIADLAHAYSLLAVIFDGLDRLDDAFEADTRALEMLETIKVLQREKDMKFSP